jgi:isoleucyl-tRNA synthetase
MPSWTAGRQPSNGQFDPFIPEGETPHSENLLDRWVLARVNQVAQRVMEELEDSDFQGASGAVSVFIDDLTNWYVRRSRRRFWKSEHDSDKGAAYATLYHVLVKLSRILAPFTPFFTEAMYQNLVRSVVPEALESIHHTRWPKVDMRQSMLACWRKWR